MLEELFNLVKGAVSQNPQDHNLDAGQADAVAAEATNTVASGFRNMVSGGGLASLVSLFGGGNNNNQQQGGLLNNPIVSMMIGHFADKLMSKFNLGSSQASSLASSLIPNVISGLVNKSNDANDSTFSLDKLLNSITGGKAEEAAQQSGGSLTDILQQIGGGNAGGGLGGLISQLAGGAQEQQQKNGGGGLMDLINGFLK